jgi:nucleoid-associated protein YgaU
MASSRYKSAIGKISRADTTAIYFAAISGALDFDKIIISDKQRLDTLSGKHYGDTQYWWVIAAASGIGWALQVPSGTIIRIPRNLHAALNIVS